MATVNSIGSEKPVQVGFGGTGVETFTDHGVIVGSAATDLTALTVGTDGQVLVGDSADDPVFATITSTDGTIEITGGAGSLILQCADATETQIGVMELATNAEVIDGSDTSRAIVPSSLKAKLGTQTDHGVLVGSGTTTAITALGVATNGQLIIGSTGADPSLAALTAGTNMTVTNSAGGISLATTVVTANAQTGTTYTLVIGDAGKLVTLTNAAAITLTVPLNASVAFATGTSISLYQGGAGTVTVAATGGVTIRSAQSNLDIQFQYSMAALIKLGTDSWVLVGDLA